MKQWENSYDTLMTELNSYASERKSQVVMGEEEKKLFPKLTRSDLYQLNIKSHEGVETMAVLTEKEEIMLANVRNGSRCRYEQLVWELEGDIDIKTIMNNYRRIYREKPVFRTNYMYSNLSLNVKIVYKPSEEVFPVTDIQAAPPEKQKMLIENLIAAEARREYNPETDSVLKLQGFLIGAGRMVILASFYPYIFVNDDVQAVLYKIFSKISVKRGKNFSVAEHEVKKMNEKLRNQCLDFWKKNVPELGKTLPVPGELKQNTNNNYKSSVYKTLDDELDILMENYCKQHSVSKKTLFIAAWVVLLGRYYSEKKPVICVTGAGECMNLYPVCSDLKLKWQEMLDSVEKQIKEDYKYSSCTTADLENMYGVKFREQFHMLHSFIEFNEDDSMGAVGGAGGSEYERSISGIKVHLNYHLFGEETGINYIYWSDSFYDVAIDRLHTIYIQTLKEVLVEEQIHFDKNKFIDVTDTDEEKMYKLQMAQIALYIQKTGLFDGRSVDELLWLAKQARQQRYSANDTVLEEKKAAMQFGIVASGYLEQSCVGRDGLVRTMCMLKQEDVFGIEALLDDNTSGVTYSVTGSETTIIWIDSSVMIDFLNQCPDNWRNMLKKASAELEKFRKLWITV